MRPSSKLVNDDCLSTYIAVGGVMGGPTAPVVVPKILVLRWGWWRFSESSKKKKKNIYIQTSDICWFVGPFASKL